MTDKNLTEVFQSCCEHYFKQSFQENKFLYFNEIPHNYFGTNYKVELCRVEYKWLGESKLNYEVYQREGSNFGKNISKFRQTCLINYTFKVNSIFIPKGLIKELEFYAESFEPFGNSISTTIIRKELIVFDDFTKIKLNIKSSFGIKNIGEIKYENDTLGFGYFTDILRKDKISKSNIQEISNYSFYSEIVQCHNEIEECLLTAIFHQQYLSDLLGRRYNQDGWDIYLPNLSYNDNQYLLMIGFGFDRLYSFWDRIIFLISNFELLGLNPNNLSFDKYFNAIEKKIQNGNNLLFDTNSKYLRWFIDFHKNQFGRITDYRHRIVHYKMTQNSEGVLTSKFSNNVSEFSANKAELQKLKLEFEGLGFLLLEQFNYCKDGFVNALKLIDELQ